MSETERKLAPEWDAAELDYGICRHAVVTKLVRNYEWLVIRRDMAPPECFADPGPADAPLKVDERVYVATEDIQGWATIRVTYGAMWDKGFRCVRMEDDRMDYGVPDAACHREGPSGPPPAEGAVFLGRFQFQPRIGVEDVWSFPPGGNIGRWGSGVSWSVTELENDQTTWSFPVHRQSYLAALAIARALGLVPKPVTEEAEPEQPEPKFVVGQVVEWGDGSPSRVVRLTSEPRWVGGELGWEYEGWQLPGGRTHVSESLGCTFPLRPHTMTIADLTDEQRRMLPGDEVRVVDVPVNHGGIPDKRLSENVFVGKRFTIRSIEPDPNGIVAWGKIDDGPKLAPWLWNLEPAKA